MLVLFSVGLKLAKHFGSSGSHSKIVGTLGGGGHGPIFSKLDFFFYHSTGVTKMLKINQKNQKIKK